MIVVGAVVVAPTASSTSIVTVVTWCLPAIVVTVVTTLSLTLIG